MSQSTPNSKVTIFIETTKASKTKKNLLGWAFRRSL